MGRRATKNKRASVKKKVVRKFRAGGAKKGHDFTYEPALKNLEHLVIFPDDEPDEDDNGHVRRSA